MTTAELPARAELFQPAGTDVAQPGHMLLYDLPADAARLGETDFKLVHME